MNTLSSDHKKDPDEEPLLVHVVYKEPDERPLLVHVMIPEERERGWPPAPKPSMFALAISEHRQRMVALIGSYRRLENLAGTTPQRELIRESLSLVEQGLQQLSLVHDTSQKAA